MEHHELPWRERGRLWLRLGVRILIYCAVALLLFYVLPPVLGLFMPFVVAFIMAWLLNPLVKWIQKKTKAPRGLISLLLILLLFGVFSGLLVGFGYTIVNEIRTLAANWESIWASFKGVFDSLSLLLTDAFKILPDDMAQQALALMNQFVQWLQNLIPTILGTLAGNAGNFAMSIPAFVVAAVIFVMGWYFIAADYPHIRFVLTDHLPPEFRIFMGKVKGTALGAFGGWLKTQVIIACVVFLILLAGFMIIGQGYALLLAFMLAILDLIPIVGSGTIMIPWAVIDLFTGNYRHAIELMVIWGVLALFRRMAEPKVLGDQTGLPPILSLVGIFIGMRLGGVFGMIVGPILLMVVINIAKGGLFDGLLADLRLALSDTTALLKNRPHEEDKIAAEEVQQEVEQELKTAQTPKTAGKKKK
ncbi:MAG: sporulation integral membrane protein YtvI [Oscillospiraceae bacterium]